MSIRTFNDETESMLLEEQQRTTTVAMEFPNSGRNEPKERVTCNLPVQEPLGQQPQSIVQKSQELYPLGAEGPREIRINQRSFQIPNEVIFEVQESGILSSTFRETLKKSIDESSSRLNFERDTSRLEGYSVTSEPSLHVRIGQNFEKFNKSKAKKKEDGYVYKVKETGFRIYDESMNQESLADSMKNLKEKLEKIRLIEKSYVDRFGPALIQRNHRLEPAERSVGVLRVMRPSEIEMRSIKSNRKNFSQHWRDKRDLTSIKFEKVIAVESRRGEPRSVSRGKRSMTRSQSRNQDPNDLYRQLRQQHKIRKGSHSTDRDSRNSKEAIEEDIKKLDEYLMSQVEGQNERKKERKKSLTKSASSKANKLRDSEYIHSEPNKTEAKLSHSGHSGFFDLDKAVANFEDNPVRKNNSSTVSLNLKNVVIGSVEPPKLHPSHFLQKLKIEKSQFLKSSQHQIAQNNSQLRTSRYETSQGNEIRNAIKKSKKKLLNFPDRFIKNSFPTFISLLPEETRFKYRHIQTIL
jgi:hypothetical protein